MSSMAMATFKASALDIDKIGPEDVGRWLPWKKRFEAFHVRSKPHAFIVLGRIGYQEVFGGAKELSTMQIKQEVKKDGEAEKGKKPEILADKPDDGTEKLPTGITKEQWVQANLDIYSNVFKGTKDSMLKHLLNVKTGNGAEAYKCVKEVFEQPDESFKRALKKEFMNLEMGANEKFTDFLFRYLKLETQLDAVYTGKEAISHTTKVTVLTEGVSEEFDPIVSVLDEVQDLKQVRVIKSFKAYAKKLERKRARKQHNKGKELALSAARYNQDKGSEKQQRESRVERRKCHNCGLTGHLVRQCKAPCGFCKMQGHVRISCFKL